MRCLLVRDLERFEVVLRKGQHQARYAQHDAEVVLVHERDEPHRPLGRRYNLRVLAVQTEERECSLLLYESLRRRRDEQTVDVLRESFGHLLAADVGDGVQRETVAELVVVVQVLSYRVDDETKKVRVLVHEQRDGEVTLNMLSEQLA